ncbi:MAG: calcium-binding protein, partial [Nocardioidaceae bacterium]
MVVLLLGTQLSGAASAQEPPLCGPPGEEVPATIVGAGTIFGTSGDDVIVASAGNDIVFAGGGNDFVCGEGGNDTLDGGNGDDVLIGDEGADAMYGGAGNDVYFVDATGDQVFELAGEGTDRVATSVSFALAASAEVETLETT